jgi:hypothetical protein
LTSTAVVGAMVVVDAEVEVAGAIVVEGVELELEVAGEVTGTAAFEGAVVVVRSDVELSPHARVDNSNPITPTERTTARMAYFLKHTGEPATVDSAAFTMNKPSRGRHRACGPSW